MFLTKEEWNKHLFTNKHLRRQTKGYRAAFFPDRKVTSDGSKKIEKAFWKIVFATRKIKEVEEFWFLYFTMVTYLKDNDLATNEEFRKENRGILLELLINHLYNKSISNNVEEKKSDCVDDRLDSWITIVSNKGPIPNNVFDYRFIETLYFLNFFLKQPGNCDKNSGNIS